MSVTTKRFYLSLLSASLLVALQGCATHSARKDVELKPIPEYKLSKMDWDTSANCIVYPEFGEDKHGDLTRCLQEQLKAAGYTVMQLDVFMTTAKRANIDKIIMVKNVSNRNLRLRRNIVWDNMAIFTVENRREMPSENPDRQCFQVWARGEKDLLCEKLSQNLLNMDSFRIALELGDNGKEQLKVTSK